MTTALLVARATLCVALLAFAPSWAHAQAYPLCPGASWTGAQPLVAAAPLAAASAARPLRDLLATVSAASSATAVRRTDMLASAARNNLDPLVYRAYFGDAAAARSPSDPSMIRLPDALKGLKDLNETKGMVAPGGHTQPGGLDGVPQGVPVALGVDAAGNACVRPASGADWKLDDHTKQIARVWDPKGFRDVALLVKFDPHAADRFKTCTLTRVAQGFAVTAAHCVIDSEVGQPIALHDFASAAARTLVLTPRLDGTPTDILGCFDHPQACGYYVSNPLARATLRSGTQWPSGSDAPVPDVALLAVAFDPGAPTAISALAAQSGASRLTIAGYGHTDATRVHDWGDLLVGWQQTTTSVDDKELVWSVDIADGQAGVCAGDSGGPVYLGDFAGLPGEAKRIGAIVSTRALPGPADAKDAKCTRTGRNTAARLDTELAWVCAAGKGTILGCPAIR